MSHLVDDLLLLSRLDARRLKLAHEQVSLAGLLQEAASQAEKLIAGKSIQLQLGQVSGAVWGDRARLRQVLLILLDNAIRFTPAGGYIRLETAPHAKTCLIMVTDNGAGIAPASPTFSKGSTRLPSAGTLAAAWAYPSPKGSSKPKAVGFQSRASLARARASR
jgi:K+-sensing histidine kinase KdpD